MEEEFIIIEVALKFSELFIESVIIRTNCNSNNIEEVLKEAKKILDKTLDVKIKEKCSLK